MSGTPPSALPRPRLLRLKDGRDYALRPLHAGDTAAVVAFFHSLSPETIRSRYGYLIHDMTPDRAHRLADCDPARELPLGIFERDAGGGERLRAMGRLVHGPDGRSAECAFVVHDDWRRLGMASRLLLHLRAAGRRRGLERLFAQVRRDNRAMLGVFRHHGARLHFRPDADYVEVDIPLLKPKILFDKPLPAPSFSVMATSGKKPFSVVTLIIDLALTAIAFGIFYWLVNSHVPSNDPAMVKLWGGLAAGCMAGVFWLAWQMLKVVFQFQRESRK
ncbi:MAG: GNAT family N-acetyltransferase [Opitutaceae bacterium]|nr:GNAT family N-acetyltransferase [Opitutaceae bacterium]